jgi:predicted nuclease of restriction endonuclease-like (RecB) superfamily
MMRFTHDRRQQVTAKQKQTTLASTPTAMDRDYQDLLRDIKSRIRVAQIRASLSVNRELIELYWDVGKMIVNRQRVEGWGKSIVDRLAADLRKNFAGIEGFSSRNIWRMRAFYVAWACDKTQSAVPKRGPERSARMGSRDREFLPQAVAEIPWGHNVILLEKLKSSAQRIWYARETTANGWSRSMLDHWIESDLYARQGKAVTNFKRVLPPPQSDLANEIVRDPYNFDFLTLRSQVAERELEGSLLTHIRKFLIELGSGFAFVGQQVRLAVDGEDFYIDLLFYHLKLRSYVVIDLKTTPFKPEYAGKMNFYLSAVDDQLRHTDDKLSIGLILCRTRSKVVAEYALRNVGTPMGVARCTTQLVESLPAEFKGSLPSPKELQAELEWDGPTAR